MNIALFGYGKMGREVERVAESRGHEIVVRSDADSIATPDLLRESSAEVVIDFSQSDAVVANVQRCASARIPIVIGTTGWLDDFQAVEQSATKGAIGLVYGANFSVGVNLFMQIVREATRLLNQADYDAYIVEAHHRAKRDAPSGTALRLAEVVRSGMPQKREILSSLPRAEAVPSNALVVSSVRAGSITGTHTVGFDAEEDSIELTHRAKNRQGFALGAVRSAEWIRGKTGMFRFEDHISTILEQTNNE